MTFFQAAVMCMACRGATNTNPQAYARLLLCLTQQGVSGVRCACILLTIMHLVLQVTGLQGAFAHTISKRQRRGACCHAPGCLRERIGAQLRQR